LLVARLIKNLVLKVNNYDGANKQEMTPPPYSVAAFTHHFGGNYATKYPRHDIS